MPREGNPGALSHVHGSLQHGDIDDFSDPSDHAPAYSSSPTTVSDSTMPTSEHSYDDPEPRHGYESYDGSGYGSPLSSRTSSAQYGNGDQELHYNKPLPPEPPATGHYDDFDFGHSFEEQPRTHTPQPMANGVHAVNGSNGINVAHLDDFKFGLPIEEQRASHHIGLNTRIRDQEQDLVGKHLLFETAMLDTQSYEILAIHEVDELKKEHARLDQRIEAAKRSLALESKVKNAAQNLQRLHSTNKKDTRPDTPQSPEKRGSGLLNNKRPGSSGIPGAQSLQQAEEEVAQSIKKVDDLNEQIKTLLDRRLVVERKLLRHTAAVLAEQANQPPDQRTNAATNGYMSPDHDDLHLRGPDEFDGIRDILRGFPVPASNKDLQKAKDEHEQQLNNMQQRLEHLNSQLRAVITEASHARGTEPAPEQQMLHSNSAHERLDTTIAVVESNVRALDHEHAQTKKHYEHLEDSTNLTRNAVEEQMEGLNTQLYNAMHISSLKQPLETLPEPPQATGDGYQHQLQYLEESLFALEDLLKAHNDDLKLVKETTGGNSREVEEAQARVEEAQTKAAAHAQKYGEYETVLGGLWDILAADAPNGLTSRGSIDENSRGDRSPLTPLKEDFSLQAFSSRVQHLHGVATGAKEQQDILRRQIQQQRDLNGKADMESQAELDEAQARYDKLAGAYNSMQEELAKTMANHQQAERDASESRGELMNVMNELEQLRKTIDDTQARQKEVDQRSVQVASEREEAVQRCNDLQVEMENMESEVVRLTTELTIAKADLEGAYGTRKERQKEAGVAVGEMDALQKLKDQEIEDLKRSQEQHVETLRREASDRAKLLETELQDMTNEFQEMTRESLELEKERGQLEGLIDSLRDRSDALEAQLNDEKMKWMGIKSPGGMDPSAPRETTSVMVLRTEFKKMMREARAEGVRLLRAEQEERRKLETELRKVRQSQGPLGRYNLATPRVNGGGPMTPSSTLSPASAAG